MKTTKIKKLAYDLCNESKDDPATLADYLEACRKEREFDAAKTMVRAYAETARAVLDRARELLVDRETAELVDAVLSEKPRKEAPRRDSEPEAIPEESSGALRSRPIRPEHVDRDGRFKPYKGMRG